MPYIIYDCLLLYKIIIYYADDILVLSKLVGEIA